jgi:hypothetical protein
MISPPGYDYNQESREPYEDERIPEKITYGLTGGRVLSGLANFGLPENLDSPIENAIKRAGGNGLELVF